MRKRKTFPFKVIHANYGLSNACVLSLVKQKIKVPLISFREIILIDKFNKILYCKPISTSK